MTKEEFGQSIKAKYPAYQNIPDADLADKMLVKYPSYSSKIDGVSSVVKTTPTETKPVQDTGIIGSEKNFGQSIADALYSGKASDIVAKNSAQHSADIQKISDLIKNNEAAGKDTSHAKLLLKTMMNEDPHNYGANLSDIIPSVDKSGKQIVGEAAGVATDLFTLAGGLSPVVAGSALGLTHALQQDKGVGGTLVDTAIGAISGKILQYGFDKVSPYISGAVAKYGKPLLEKLQGVVPEAAMKELQTIADNALIKGTDIAKKVTIGSGEGGTKVLNTINNWADKPTDYLSKLITKSPEINTLAGKVVQGKPEDITSAVNALGHIDTKGVKTYADLETKLNDKIKTLSVGKDEYLAGSPIHSKPLKLGDLEISTKVGDKTVRHNYIEDSINQLKDHYTAINDVKGLAKITALEEKANAEGITVQELDKLAIEQGQAINAWKKNGDLASSNKAQAAENTRAGIKSTAREIFGDPVYGEIDSKLSDLINTRDLAKDMVDKVNALQQKTKEAGIGAKTGKLIMKTIDLAGGGLLKGAARELMGKGETTTLNALDLQKVLQKNLSAIDDILNSKSEAEMTPKLNALIGELSKGVVQTKDNILGQ